LVIPAAVALGTVGTVVAGFAVSQAPAAAQLTPQSTAQSAAQSAAAALQPPVSVPLITAPPKPGCPKLDGSSPHYTHFRSAPRMCINPSKSYTATMVTDVGTITIKLFASQDPVTVNNFVFLAGYHFYDGTAFHRVVTDFVDQGGDPTGTGMGGPGYSFNGGEPKSASVYTAGAIAMANAGGPSSDGSQFFIVVGSGGEELQPLYSYLGHVTTGIGVVNRINRDGSATGEGTPKVLHKVIRVTIRES